MLKRAGFISFSILFLSATSPTIAFASGGDMPSLVHDIGICLFLAGFLAVIFARFKIPSVAAFLVAGIIAGPIGLRQVTDPANIDTIAQLGFILLLFMIGLEINVRKILNSGKVILVTGAIQYPLTVLFGFGAVKALLWMGIGIGLLDGPYAPIYIGIVLAGSSTLLIVKLFQENFELDTQPGRIALGILIFQDIWAIIALLIQPNLDDPQIMPIMLSFLGIAVLILFSVILSRTVATIGFKWIAKLPELILVGAIGWCFAVVFFGMSLDIITQALFGINLHIAVGSGMGALIAGATIASLPYSIEIITKVGVVKDFFVTLFFVGLGMSIPAPTGWDIPLIALLIAVLGIVARQLLFFPILYWMGADQRNAEVASVRLMPLSEFGLVIAFLGIQLGHLEGELASAIIFAFVITSLLANIIYNGAYSFHERAQTTLAKCGFKEPPAATSEKGESHDIAILGFYRDASSLLHELAEKSPDTLKKILVVDFNVDLHDKIRDMGVEVEYGDLSNDETLLHAGVGSAKIVLCTIPDDLLRGINTQSLVKTVRRLNPDALIIANAVDTSAAPSLYEAGANFIYMPRVETARSLEGILNHALEGTLEDYRQNRIDTHGHFTERKEVLT